MEKKKQRDQLLSKAQQLAQTLPEQSGRGVPSDVLGSYTGSPLGSEVPEQDADDL